LFSAFSHCPEAGIQRVGISGRELKARFSHYFGKPPDVSDNYDTTQHHLFYRCKSGSFLTLRGHHNDLDRTKLCTEVRTSLVACKSNPLMEAKLSRKNPKLCMLWPVPYESEMKSNSAVVELLNSFEKDGQSFFLDQASHVSNLESVPKIRQITCWTDAGVRSAMIYRECSRKRNPHRHVICHRDVSGDALAQPPPRES